MDIVVGADLGARLAAVRRHREEGNTLASTRAAFNTVYWQTYQASGLRGWGSGTSNVWCCRIAGVRVNVGRERNIEIGYFFTDEPLFFCAP